MNQNLSIEGTGYRVTGGIEFHNRSDSSRWTEYCLKEIEGGRTKWLSVDNIYGEYAIYTQCPYSSEFDEMNIFCSGYRQADAGRASVISCFGGVDTEPGDTVRYKEYEDGTQELIMAVEQWEDETEYSHGYYLDLEEIVLLDSGSARTGDGGSGSSGAGDSGFGGSGAGFGLSVSMAGGTVTSQLNKKNLAIAVIVLMVLGIFSYSYMQSNKKTIHKFLESNTRFSYHTSITSDLNDKEKADVYLTSLSVDEAVKAVIQGIDGEIQDVQKNKEDDSVAILTKTEYCLVYTSTDRNTTVQVSSRAYAYQSTNTPYHASHRTHSYYRGFYYSTGFLSDRDRYRRSASGFENYSGDTVDANPVDTYRSYSDSVRQSSINSRRSSGGGISSGK